MYKIFKKLTDVSNGGQKLPLISRKILEIIHGYNHRKYWRRRSVVIDPNNKTNIIVKLLYLIYIKRIDARHHCSFGTTFHSGAKFATPPFLPHGPNGIIVGGGCYYRFSCYIISSGNHSCWKC